MEEITLVCAQKLIDDLLRSSSSSDEDNDLFAVLSNSNRHQTENLAKNKVNATTVTVQKDKQEENNFDDIIINLLSESDPTNLRNVEEDNEIATAFAGNNDEDKENPLENAVNSNSSYDEFERNIGISGESDAFSEDEDTTVLVKNNEQVLQENTFEDNVMHSLSENDFKENFHISRGSAIYLMEKYSLWYCNSSFQESTKKATVTTNLLSFLWFCTNAISFGNVAQQLNTSLADINQSINNVLKFFMEVMASEVIKLPTSYIEKEAVAKEFEKIAGFPNVLGCIAESYFRLKSQKLVQKCGSSQVYLRGICDSNRRFIDVKIGLPKEVTNDTFLEKDLPKLCFPKYHLLGDSKCPIRGHLMIPFENNATLSDSEQYFNIKLYRTHVKIKNAFGILRSRFQQLKCLDFDNIETMSKFILSCCIIHNICIDRDDFYNGEIYTDVSDRLYSNSFASAESEEFLTDLGVMKRSELQQILFKDKR